MTSLALQLTSLKMPRMLLTANQTAWESFAWRGTSPWEPRRILCLYSPHRKQAPPT